jgi:hypothetical protein
LQGRPRAAQGYSPHEKYDSAHPDRRHPFSLISGIVVSIIGLMLGWKTSTQFSDGFFLAGAIMISIGLISFQGYGQRTISTPPVYLDPAERSSLWAADTFRGKNLMALFGISGLLLFGLSFLAILVGRLF